MHSVSSIHLHTRPPSQLAVIYNASYEAMHAAIPECTSIMDNWIVKALI